MSIWFLQKEIMRVDFSITKKLWIVLLIAIWSLGCFFALRWIWANRSSEESVTNTQIEKIIDNNIINNQNINISNMSPWCKQALDMMNCLRTTLSIDEQESFALYYQKTISERNTLSEAELNLVCKQQKEYLSWLSGSNC